MKDGADVEGGTCQTPFLEMAASQMGMTMAYSTLSTKNDALETTFDDETMAS